LVLGGARRCGNVGCSVAANLSRVAHKRVPVPKRGLSRDKPPPASVRLQLVGRCDGSVTERPVVARRVRKKQVCDRLVKGPERREGHRQAQQRRERGSQVELTHRRASGRVLPIATSLDSPWGKQEQGGIRLV